VHRENRYFAGRQWQGNARAVGVNPPWKTNATAPAFASTPTAASRDFTEAFLEVRFPNTTAGSRLPLFFRVRLCIAKIVFSPTSVRAAIQERGA
jgi:hypothetical protein